MKKMEIYEIDLQELSKNDSDRLVENVTALKKVRRVVW